MLGPWVTVWHLSLVIALILFISLKEHRRKLIIGGLVSMPVLLLVPALSGNYLGFFDNSALWQFFVSNAVVVFSLGVIVSALYEQSLRPRVVKKTHSSRHHFLFFLAGLALSLIIFDIFAQPLLPSLIYGLGLNFLLALQYYSDEIYDIAFSTILMALFYLFIYVAVLIDLPGEASNFWFSNDLSGLTMFGIAIEKLITIVFFGAFWGPLYVGLKDVLIKKN